MRLALVYSFNPGSVPGITSFIKFYLVGKDASFKRGNVNFAASVVLIFLTAASQIIDLDLRWRMFF